MINKKVKCLQCATVVEGSDGKCECGKIVLKENTLISIGIEVGKDFIDMTPRLLAE